MNSPIHQYIMCKAYIVLGKNAQEDKGGGGLGLLCLCLCHLGRVGDLSEVILGDLNAERT